jgi:hypothetical protein
MELDVDEPADLQASTVAETSAPDAGIEAFFRLLGAC